MNIEMVLSRYGPDEEHGRPHVERVLKYALTIADAEGRAINREALQLAAVYHDITRGRSHPGNHGLTGSLVARRELVNFIEPTTLDVVIASIREHNRLEKATYFEGQILQDADKLDAIGAVGLVRDVRDNKDLCPATFARHMQHWNLEWYDKFWTAKGLELAKGRLNFSHVFVDHLTAELADLDRTG